jgi:hypothetical protein
VRVARRYNHLQSLRGDEAQGGWLKMAGAAGIEPANGGIKSRCLTAWRRPIILAFARSGDECTLCCGGLIARVSAMAIAETREFSIN